MVDAVDLVAEELKEAGDGVANDGGAEVTDVHFLSDVGAGEVDEDTLVGDLGGEDAGAGGVGHRVSDPRGRDVDVDEALRGGLDALDEVVGGDALGDGVTNVLGAHLDGRGEKGERLGEAHSVVALVVGGAVALGAGLTLSDEDLWESDGGEGAGDTLAEEALEGGLDGLADNLAGHFFSF